MTGTASSPSRATIGIRWIPIVASAVIVTVAITVALLARDGNAIATTTLVNRAGGYQLEYPNGWRTASVRSTTTFVSPKRDVVVGVGRAPRGALDEAAKRFQASALATYHDVAIDGREQLTIADRDALAFAGSALNETSARVRWLTLTVRHGETNLGIWVFAGQGSDPSEVLPQLHTLVSSFRPLA